MAGKELVIVGHGPSAISAKFGRMIDEFDVVVRQKRCEETLNHPEIYGTRTDVVSGSFTIAGSLMAHIDSPEYWVFMDSRHKNVPNDEVSALKYFFESCGKKILIDRELCDGWNDTYRGMRSHDAKFDYHQEKKKTSDDLGHTHMSAGLHTILYAAKHVKPKAIYLLGFDNVMNGDFTWSITRGPDWAKYPDHRWDTEKSMIPLIMEAFNVDIKFIMPEVMSDRVCNKHV